METASVVQPHTKWKGEGRAVECRGAWSPPPCPTRNPRDTRHSPNFTTRTHQLHHRVHHLHHPQPPAHPHPHTHTHTHTHRHPYSPTHTDPHPPHPHPPHPHAPQEMLPYLPEEAHGVGWQAAAAAAHVYGALAAGQEDTVFGGCLGGRGGWVGGNSGDRMLAEESADSK